MWKRSITRMAEVKHLRTILRMLSDKSSFLASYYWTYIMAVNADDAVNDFLPFKHLLFLYKNLSDDGKTLLVILSIAE